MLHCSWQLEGVVVPGEVSLPGLLSPGRALGVGDRVVCVCLPRMLWLHNALMIVVLSSEQLAHYPGSEKEDGRRGTKLWKAQWFLKNIIYARSRDFHLLPWCWMRSIRVLVLLLSSETPMVWVPVDSLWKISHVQWSSCVPYAQERRTERFIWVSGGRENNVTVQSLFKPEENLCDCCKLLPLVDSYSSTIIELEKELQLILSVQEHW